MTSRGKQLRNKQSPTKSKAARKNPEFLENPDWIAKVTTVPKFLSAITIASVIGQNQALGMSV